MAVISLVTLSAHLTVAVWFIALLFLYDFHFVVIEKREAQKLFDQINSIDAVKA